MPAESHSELALLSAVFWTTGGVAFSPLLLYWSSLLQTNIPGGDNNFLKSVLCHNVLILAEVTLITGRL